METTFAALSQGLSVITNWASGPIALTFTGLGVLSLAILQALKDLTPVRRWFQRWWLGSWFDQRVESFNNARGSALPATDALSARQQLVALATGGEEKAFYDLPADQLVAQMNAAAQIAVDYPGTSHYYKLFAVLSEGADVTDIAAVQGVPSIRMLAASGSAPPPSYTDARTRVSHRLQRNLDGLQIAMSDRWQWCLQLAANAICILAVEAAVWSQGTAVRFAGLAVGIVAGYLAPVLRDLVAALQKLRG